MSGISLRWETAYMYGLCCTVLCRVLVPSHNITR